MHGWKKLLIKLMQIESAETDSSASAGAGHFYYTYGCGGMVIDLSLDKIWDQMYNVHDMAYCVFGQKYWKKSHPMRLPI